MKFHFFQKSTKTIFLCKINTATRLINIKACQNYNIQVKLEKFEYCAFNLKAETNIFRLITCKVRYFKTLCVIILMITDMKTPKSKLEYCGKVFISVIHNHQNYNK